MTRALEAGADAALQAEHVSQVVFVEFDFLSGVSRVCSREHSVSWNGFTWLGAGRVGSIEPVGEGGELEARGVAMTLSALPAGLLATALTPGEYKGREVRIWFGQIEPEIIDFDFTQGTLTAQVGAALAEIGFTRAGATATRVNELGLIEVVAADTPRFDYDPVTLECKGLRIEEGRTQLIGRTDFGAGWSGSGTVVDGPMGVVGRRVTWVATAYPQSAYTIAVVSGTAYTFSIRFKHDTPGVLFALVSNAGNLALNTNLVATGEWQEHIVTATATGTGAANFLVVFNNSGAVTTDGCEISMPQAEAGAIRTSFIPNTTGAAVTRNADVPVDPDISAFYNAIEGSFVLECSPLAATGNVQRALQIDDGGTNERHLVQYAGDLSTLNNHVIDGGVDQGQLAGASNGAGGIDRCAIAYKLNDRAASFNGGAATTDSVATMPTVGQLNFGVHNLGLGFNGHLRRFIYVPKRRGDAALVAVSGGADPLSLAVGTRIAASPAGPFIFKMDQLSYQLGSTATLRLTAESRLVDWNRPRVRRYNNSDHQALHPGDRFFEHTEKQIEQVYRW